LILFVKFYHPALCSDLTAIKYIFRRHIILIWFQQKKGLSMHATSLQVKNKVASPRMHPVLRALRSLRTGTFAVTLPGGKELFYGGSKPGIRAEMRIHDWSALDYIASRGDIGLGESYVLGLWGYGKFAEPDAAPDGKYRRH
jgi:hypothetical protein